MLGMTATSATLSNTPWIWSSPAALKRVQDLVQTQLHAGLQAASKAERKRRVSAAPLHNGRLHGHLEHIGVVQVQIRTRRSVYISKGTHDAPTNTPTKMKINTVPATSKPNVDPMAELKMFFSK